MHYYKRNLGDYAKKAGRLSMLQHGSYTLLIDACYDREQFPTLDEAVEWTWASTTEEVEAVEFVLKRFFTLEDGRYLQKRIQEEIAEYHGKSETNKRIALEREAKRKESLRNRARTVNQSCATEDESPPNQEPITKNQEPITNTKDAVAGFSDDLDLGEVVMPMNDAERELGVHLALVKPKPVKARSPEFFEVPDWINRAHWDAWHSCAKRKKATPEQKQMAVDKLDQWRREGVDFAAALESAALAGWQGLFKPDDRKASTTTFSNRNTNKYAGAAAAIWGNDAPLDERTINV